MFIPEEQTNYTYKCALPSYEFTKRLSTVDDSTINPSPSLDEQNLS